MRPSEAQNLCAQTLEAIDAARGRGIPDALLDADAARLTGISNEIDMIMSSLAAGMLRHILANPDDVPNGFPDTDLGIRFLQHIARDLGRTSSAYGVVQPGQGNRSL